MSLINLSTTWNRNGFDNGKPYRVEISPLLPDFGWVVDRLGYNIMHAQDHSGAIATDVATCKGVAERWNE